MTVNLKTVVLNADMQPLKIIPRLEIIEAQRAVTRVINGTCVVIESYDRKIKTKNLEMHWPSVILRKDFLHPRKLKYVSDNVSEDFLYYRDHGMCVYYHKKLSLTEGTFDHYIPTSRGGSTSWDNIVLACSSCNNAKGNEIAGKDTWVPFHLPFKPTYDLLEKNARNMPLRLYNENQIPYIGKWHGEVYVR